MKKRPSNPFTGTSVPAILVTACLVGSPVFAADYFHLGGTNLRFDQAANYSNTNGSATAATVAPGASDNLFFYNSLVAGPENRTFELGDTSTTYNSLTFGSNAGTTQINRAAAGSGTTHILGIGAGGITVASGAGPITFGAGSNPDGQRVDVAAFASYTVANNSSSDLTFFREFSGRTNNTTHVVTVAGSGDGDTIFKSIRSYSHGRNIAMTINKTSGTGVVRFDGTNDYTGATTVTAGTLVINGNISTSITTTVAAGATLSGSGTIGAATISGILSPGNSIGTLTATGDVTWNANQAWVFELGLSAADLSLANTTGTRDLLNITGTGSDFLKGTGSTFTFDFANTGETGFYKLVDWTGTSTFVDADFTATNLASGLAGTFIVDDSTSALYINVIPEPSAALLGGLGMLLLLRRRRA